MKATSLTLQIPTYIRLNVMDDAAVSRVQRNRWVQQDLQKKKLEDPSEKIIVVETLLSFESTLGQVIGHAFKICLRKHLVVNGSSASFPKK